MQVERVQRRDLVVLLSGLAAVAVTVWAFRALPAIVPTTVGLALLLVVLVTVSFDVTNGASAPEDRITKVAS